MGSAGTMGFAAIMGSEAIMGSGALTCSEAIMVGLEAPGFSSGSGRIGDPIGRPMSTRQRSLHPLLQSMSNRHRRQRHTGTIVTACRATIPLSRSALAAGARSYRRHGKEHPSAG